MKFFTTASCLIFSCTFLSAQFSFTAFPADNQLLPRDLSTNSAAVYISGTTNLATFDSLIFTMESSDGPLDRLALAAADLPNGLFNQVYEITAALHTYDFTVAYKIAGTTSVIASAVNVVAGDVFMVQGQSNAQAVAYNGDANIWQSNYVRSYGNSNPADYTNQQWYTAEGNGYFTPGAVGQWALRMGSLLQENRNIPIAIINGADPGKPIEFFQRNDTFPTDPATNYGRLLQRLNNGNLTDHIRGIIFYQGESDGVRADIHKMLFEALYADWAADIPDVEAYYVIQVREGCGAPSLQLREYQRLFEDYLPKLKCVTANGINGHDGCHYSVLGYGQLGEKMYKQLSADLYNMPSGEQLNIRISEARFSNDVNSQLILTTDASALIAQAGSLADFKISNFPGSIIDLAIDSNEIILDLDGPVFQAGLGVSYSGHSGDGNGWILNGDGYGMFSYFEVPIEDYSPLPNFDIPGIMSGPGNCIALDGVDDHIYIGPVLNSSYTKEAWVNWQGGGQGNNIISGIGNTAFWAPANGLNYFLAGGHNGAWGQVVDPAPMIPYQWVHVAITYDENLSELNLYRNGNLVSTALDVPAHNDPELFVGAYSGAFTFHGKIDEVRVWDYARSLSEIRNTMCQKLKGDEPGLSSYFRLDQIDGSLAYNVTDKQDGVLNGFQAPGWQRSAAPIGTKSTYSYEDTNYLSLSLASGDSLVLSDMSVPEFVHLYFTEEPPNVLQPAENHLLVDNARYFGLYYPNGSIDSFSLRYHYSGNPFSTVNEPNLSLLERKNNAQPFWKKSDSQELDIAANYISTIGNRYQEYILAINDNIISAVQNPDKYAGFLYPNPTSGLLFVKELAVERVVVYDALGKRCFEHNGQTRILDIGALPAGLYLILIWDKEGKLYKQRIVLQQRV